MAFTGPAEDRQLIRERMDAYADSVFRRDLDAWLANWTEECVWSVAGNHLERKATLRAQWPTIWRTFDRMTFFNQIGAIEADGDRATARCYCREIILRADGTFKKVVGAYDDILVRERGVWLFASRSYALFQDEGAPTISNGR